MDVMGMFAAHPSSMVTSKGKDQFQDLGPHLQVSPSVSTWVPFQHASDSDWSHTTLFYFLCSATYWTQNTSCHIRWSCLFNLRTMKMESASATHQECKHHHHLQETSQMSTFPSSLWTVVFLLYVPSAFEQFFWLRRYINFSDWLIDWCWIMYCLLSYLMSV